MRTWPVKYFVLMSTPCTAPAGKPSLFRGLLKIIKTAAWRSREPFYRRGVPDCRGKEPHAFSHIKKHRVCL